MTAADPIEAARALVEKLRALLPLVTPGEWFYNGYAGIESAELQTPANAQTWPEEMTKAEETAWYRAEVYHQTETRVATVPPIAGDTATGRHGYDAEWIATLSPANVRLLLDAAAGLPCAGDLRTWRSGSVPSAEMIAFVYSEIIQNDAEEVLGGRVIPSADGGVGATGRFLRALDALGCVVRPVPVQRQESDDRTTQMRGLAKARGDDRFVSTYLLWAADEIDRLRANKEAAPIASVSPAQQAAQAVIDAAIAWEATQDPRWYNADLLPEPPQIALLAAVRVLREEQNR